MNRIAIILLLLLGSTIGFAQSADEILEARDRLSRAGAVWRAETAGYLSVRFKRPLTYSTTKPEIAAQAFLGEHSQALGLKKTEDLTLLRSNKGIDGGHYLRYQQLRNGIPVLGAELTLEISASGAVRGLAGALFPPTYFAPAAAPQNPTRPDDFFRQRAKASLYDRHPFAHQWDVVEEALVWVSRNPWQPASANPLHLTRTFTVSEPAHGHEETVYLDADTGELIFRHQLHCDLNRRLYNRYQASFNVIWNENDAFPGNLDAENQEMLVSTAETYNLFSRTFGRNSYDGIGGRMNTVTNATFNGNALDNFGCPNARAGTNSIRHCDGVVTDDVVAHEWTHVYIYGMNGLLYAYESGAINEGYSDIFGECLDLLNDRGNDTNDHLLRTTCVEDNMRWQIAEDAIAIDTTLRDLWLPECKEDASSRDSPYFMCSPGETDAVHTNSGLVNRTFVLLTDGGVVGGDTILSIGMTKALHIFHHANANYITRVTDFFALGDMLLLSANDLLGIDLPELTLIDLPAPFSGEIIDSSDIAQVIKAIGATQLQGEGPCMPTPALTQSPPSNCATALLPNFTSIMEQDWEDSLGTWTVTQTAVIDSTWDDKPWQISGTLPDGRSGMGVFAPNPDVGNCGLDLDNGVVSLTSPVIELPIGESEFRLTFDHYFALQEDFDGGVLYVAVNDGDFQLIPNEAFLFNGYNGLLSSSFENDNPLAGQRAFHGADDRSTSGTWGRSIVDLALAGAFSGDEIQLRWTLGHDGCDGWLGWYLDDVRIGFCGGMALPVEFLTFTATPAKDRVRLDWTTAHENNNTGFFVERRNAAGGNYQELGFVSATTGTYTFTDHDVLPGAAYVYRLRQQDLDGTERYSNLLTVRIPTGGRLLAYPNPTQDQLTISAPVSADAAELYDSQGRLTTRMVLTDGRGQLTTATLPAGVYFLRVEENSRRVVVVR